MLSGIFGRKSDHPLADIQSVHTLLANLPKNDTIKLVMELTEWIESVNENSDFKLDHQFAVLRMFDEFVQPHAKKLMREFFSAHELNQFQENRLWLVLGNLAQHTARAHFTVFSRYCNAEKGSNVIREQVPLLMARTVYAMSSQLKYICARYGPVDKSFWSDLAFIYKHAEQNQCLDTPVNLYPSLVGNTSARYELGHLLAWYGIEVNALSPLYMHLIERLIAQYSSAIVLDSKQNDTNLFSFDLNVPTAPVRVKVDGTSYPTSRFINMSAMQSRLVELLKILEKNIVPDDLNLGGSYEAGLVKEAAQHLLDYLISPPARRNERRKIKVSFGVVSGFVGLMDMMGADSLADRQQVVSWTIEDISVGGFRTILPGQGAGDVRIGSLLGMKLDGVAHWGVAVVRRMTRDDHKQMHVGAEILVSQVASVSVRLSVVSGGVPEDSRRALWLLDSKDESSNEALLLMDADTFSLHRSLQTQLNGKRYLLIPVGLQERCVDCELARFRVIEQEGVTE